ncbi:pectate lyase, PelA/Pel-15E family [Hymenobacter gelipurpurascens]|uniref:Pectate lyase, PelA/Pel-15E family n=1 Tax=Hymenobacter gelipurpurascens TaxID=89968 RepID=A0A212TJS2_9BACT|nr:pectate lyase [Hymenobacter gelipurpurascens]SNC66319.1 pectate lyase, PelA/Pel-15E family [Hymenobacter gelipurpurascens]
MKNLLKLLLLLVGVGEMGIESAHAQQVTVASDGSGNFRTIQAALNSLPNEATKPRTVYIKNGTYREKVFIDGKQQIILKGQSETGVVLAYAQARDEWRCDPTAGQDDWGVATLNMRNSPDVTLENLTVINSYGFDAKGPVTVPCPTDPTGQRTISKTGHQMALRTMPGTTRLTVKHCTFRALGGDTVSPWDVDAGLYYFKDCTMEGGVDFYCPRGWAYAENCRFICHNTNAAIWHDGSGNKDQKTVLRNCTFEGDDNFKLGRFHREAQFYLVNCTFAKNMADADIYWAQSGPGAKQWGRRVYYQNSHHEGGDYAWHQDNLKTAEGAPKARKIKADWTYGGRWYPVSGKKATVALPPSNPLHTNSVLPTAANQQADQVDSVAEKMLVYQRSVGGWPKAVKEVKVDYTKPLSAALRAATLADAGRTDATIDNKATTREITYLLKAYKATNRVAYKAAAERGIQYLLKMQYANGGFPQYYPDFSNYRHQITYNDNAMVLALEVLRSVAKQEGDFTAVDPALVPLAKGAVERGVACILKTQYVQNGQLTAWCAQYDEKTLQPAKARAFELASLSGDESAAIVEFLLGVENPSPEVKKAIASAIAWFEKVKMPNQALKEIKDPAQPSGRDRVIVAQPGASLWARFYDLETNRPIYVGRDSKVHYALSEIENERRAGYVYAGTWPEKLLQRDYPKWQQKWATNSTKQEGSKL